MIDELQEMQGMEEPGIFLKEGSSFGIGELPAVKIENADRSEREGRVKNDFEGGRERERIQEEEKCLIVPYSRAGRELAR